MNLKSIVQMGLATLVAVTGAVEAGAAAPKRPTYAKDVAPIMNAKWDAKVSINSPAIKFDF